MELTYTTRGDYLLPDLNVPESPKIGKYGMLRRSYLREHRDGIYTGMLLSGKLNGHLEEIDRTAFLDEVRITIARFEKEKPQVHNPPSLIARL